MATSQHKLRHSGKKREDVDYTGREQPQQMQSCKNLSDIQEPTVEPLLT